MRRGLLLALLMLLGASLLAAEPAAPTDKAGSWAFHKPVRVDAPHVSDPHWVKNSIDAFVLARLDKAGLKPSAPAGRKQRAPCSKWIIRKLRTANATVRERLH